MAPSTLPDVNVLRHYFSYDPETGELRWKRPQKGIQVGRIAGNRNANGSIGLAVEGQKCLAHRVIWKMTTGRDPVADINHIDGDRSNNRLSNLREATRSQVGYWKKSHPRKANKDLPRGARPAKGKFQACLKADRTFHHLGVFDTPEEAEAAYIEASLKMHGVFSTHHPESRGARSSSL